MTIHEGWERFYIPEPNSGCWLWLGPVNSDGYGQRRLYKAPNLFFEMQFGPVPEGLCVCHRCDNPLCVNPDHLWLGTHLENMRDKAKKGRVKNQFGENNPNAKLTHEQALQVKASTERYKIIARKFGITADHVKSIKSGKRSWSSL